MRWSRETPRSRDDERMTATAHHIHGWSDDAIAPDWPPLEQDEVQTLLSGFSELRGPARIVWHSPRPFSAAARVVTPAGEVFVKRHHVRVRSAAGLSVEHAFIKHLRHHGAPVPRVLADDRGQTAIACGDWTYEIHTLADGIDLYRDTVSWTPLSDLGQARSAGRTLANLHRAAADFSSPPRDTWMLVARDDLLRATDLVAEFETQIARRPGLARYLAQRDWQRELAAVIPLHRTVQPRLADLPRLWTHGDWHVSNLCWSSDARDASISAILDFGLCAPTFALYDLATAIERNAIAWLHLDHGMQAIFPQTARALLRGYADILPLAQADLELLADLLPVVHMDFALSEVEYFHDVIGANEHADLAWEGFLLGHAAWFSTPPGYALLQAIRSAS